MPHVPGAGWIFSPIRPLFFENKQTTRRVLEKWKLYPKQTVPVQRFTPELCR